MVSLNGEKSESSVLRWSPPKKETIADASLLQAGIWWKAGLQQNFFTGEGHRELSRVSF